jgi:hypothetical protein
MATHGDGRTYRSNVQHLTIEYNNLQDGRQTRAITPTVGQTIVQCRLGRLGRSCALMDSLLSTSTTSTNDGGSSSNDDASITMMISTTTSNNLEAWAIGVTFMMLRTLLQVVHSPWLMMTAGK